MQQPSRRDVALSYNGPPPFNAEVQAVLNDFGRRGRCERKGLAIVRADRGLRLLPAQPAALVCRDDSALCRG